MGDERVEMTGLADGPVGHQVLDRLDSVRIVLTVAPGRGTTAGDIVGLANLVNLGARIFPHWKMCVPAGVDADVALLGRGQLATVLDDLRSLVAPSPSREPDATVEVCWGGQPAGAGLAVDAAGWSCSVGPTHLPLAAQTGPPIGALAAGGWVVGQLLARTLGPLGFSSHQTAGFRWNLLTYGLDDCAPIVAGRPMTEPPMLPAWTNAGCGSVGSSLLYAALLAGAPGGPVDLVDPDGFTPRNRMRYPILLEALDGVEKVVWLAERCAAGGIAANPRAVDITAYTNTFSVPPDIDLAVVSVDTVEGRRDATDLLAATTLNVGVAGLALHISRHGFGMDGCAYCQYVDVQPALSGAQMLADLVGLPVERVVALQEGDGRLTAEDVARLQAHGRYGDSVPVAGQRLADLRRRAYAQASIVTHEGDLRVSAPHVSAMAGVVALAEAIKHADPALADLRLRGRLDLDLSGQPAGFVSHTPVDATGRCLCHSGFRRRAWAELRGGTAPG